MKEYLDCIMDIAEEMLISGAEVHRAEDSVRRMCTAVGAKRTDVFIITSSMVATVHTKDGESLTQTRRITSSGTDIERLHRLNSLSRRICNDCPAVESVRNELKDIKSCKTYPLWLEYLAYAVIAASFTLFFGGNFKEALVSFPVGLLLKLVVVVTDKTMPNKFFAKFICTFLATASAFLAVKVGFIASVDKVIIGNIMTLIPGIGLTTALRDLFTGDSIAGLLRSIEAVLIALAIAGGYFLCMLTVGGVAV